MEPRGEKQGRKVRILGPRLEALQADQTHCCYCQSRLSRDCCPLRAPAVGSCENSAKALDTKPGDNRTPVGVSRPCWPHLVRSEVALGKSAALRNRSTRYWTASLSPLGSTAAGLSVVEVLGESSARRGLLAGPACWRSRRSSRSLHPCLRRFRVLGSLERVVADGSCGKPLLVLRS